MHLKDMNFENPNNACQSLRIIAELVRRGDAKVQRHEVKDAGGLFYGSVEVMVVEPRQGRR